jgi:hypothetical protein
MFVAGIELKDKVLVECTYNDTVPTTRVASAGS